MEVARAIAEKLGVEARFVEGEWDGLLAGLSAGRYDIMVNGVDIDPCLLYTSRMFYGLPMAAEIGIFCTRSPLRASALKVCWIINSDS